MSAYDLKRTLGGLFRCGAKHFSPNSVLGFGPRYENKAYEAARVNHTTYRRGGDMAGGSACAADANKEPNSDFPSGNSDDPADRNWLGGVHGARFSASYAAWVTSKEEI